MDSLDAFFDEQTNRIFDKLWVTTPGGNIHVTKGERQLLEDRARRQSEALGEDWDTQENRK